jgi:hypothetical protein
VGLGAPWGAKSLTEWGFSPVWPICITVPEGEYHPSRHAERAPEGETC